MMAPVKFLPSWFHIRPLGSMHLPRDLLLVAGFALSPAHAQAPMSEPAVAPSAPGPAESTPKETTVEPEAAGRQSLAKNAVMPILGREVKGPNGVVMARIVNLLVDDAAQPIGAVLDYGGYLGVGKRRIAVAWRMLHVEKSVITMTLTRDQLKDFPDFRDDEDAVLAIAPATPG